MSRISEKALLVGDNPFHKISHLSQERIRARDYDALSNPLNAASLIMTSLENGANGFMFSVSDTTLSALKVIREKGKIGCLGLYVIVPYAYEYVKLATHVGGISGLAKEFSKHVVLSGDVRTMMTGVIGLIRPDPVYLMQTYLLYEINRVKSAAGKQANICSLLLHEVITDMALALNLEWLFEAYINLMARIKITPGFNTCNFPYLVNKFREWHLDLHNTVIAAPFNKIGFQMNPSQPDCEKALESLPGPILVAISMLAAGYLTPIEATDYIAGLPNIKGVAVGVSREEHACQTFNLLAEKFGQ